MSTDTSHGHGDGVAGQLQRIFAETTSEVRDLIAHVLEVERRSQHLTRPHVGQEIEDAVRRAARTSRK